MCVRLIDGCHPPPFFRRLKQQFLEHQAGVDVMATNTVLKPTERLFVETTTQAEVEEEEEEVEEDNKANMPKSVESGREGKDLVSFER